MPPRLAPSPRPFRIGRRLSVAACVLGTALGTVIGVGTAAAQPDNPFRPGATPPADPFRDAPEPAPAPAVPDQPGEQDRASAIEQLFPQLRAGYKAEFLRQRQQTTPVLVIVPDEASYIQALAAWKPLLRFPVLLDDGTPGAREDIARFVRGFKPEQVVRWSADAPALDTAGSIRDAAETAHRAVWGYGTAEVPTLGDAVTAASDVEAPGVVVLSPSDPAWTGGLALAIGRGQPMIWIDARQDVSGALSVAESDALCAAVESALTELGKPWQELGDTIDTVALCLNTPARTATTKTGEWIATTDRLGHATAEPTDSNRWGWASQIHGNQAQAAYRAMCGLFLHMPTGWFYDSYPGGQPWDSYALRFARDAIGGEGALEIVLTERPENGLVRWRVATLEPINAALLMVNTKGMRNYFEFVDGTAWCGDVPFLNVPAAMHFIHSFSAFQPGDRNTIAGRWFERGVFAYVGSVQEPYLSAFVPPAALAGRLRALAPWAVACRSDTAPAWRIAVFGDPLLVLAREQERVTDPLPLDGAVVLDDTMRTALRGGDMAKAIDALVLLGRDADAARLAVRLRAEDPGSVSPAVAAAAIGPLFRTNQAAEFQAFYALLDEAAARDPAHRDMLWISVRNHLPRDGSVMGMLRPHIRPEQQTPDTSELALLAAASGQREAAITLLTEWRRTRSDVGELKLIDRTMELIRGR